MSRRIYRIIAPLLLLATLPALAQQAADLGRLRNEQLALRPLIEAGKGPYVNIPKEQRERVLLRQGELLALIEGKQDLASLDEGQRLAVLNAMSALDAAERNAEHQRQVCKRTKTLGSHRMSTVCRSVADIREAEEDARHGIGNSIGGCGNASTGAECAMNQPDPRQRIP